MQGDGIQSLAEDKEGTIQSKKIEKMLVFKKPFAGGCLAAFGAYLVSESVFTMSILSVTVLLIVALFQEDLR